MDISDDKIVRQCQKNSRDGYRLLFEKYRKYVYTLCYRSTFNQEDAMDLVQEVFIKVFRGMARFEAGKPILPWIKRITINVCINHSQRSPKNETAMDFQEEASVALLGQSHQAGPDERLQTNETRSAIEASIAELPGNERTAVILRHFEGRSYDEIAKVMAVPLGSVKTYLYRARRLLKESLVRKGIWEV
ncbi:MAG: RNA polymerase sigma factor [Clostridia bacterium]|nr:RNA polymerase sigma factor [Clostridia bacterium]